MPVKVRCPQCEKVLNVPDAARGKSVKCPACETRVPVPAAAAKAAGTKTSAAPPTRKRKTAEDDDFLSGLDLSRAEDNSVQLCPKCGAERDEDALECPECGIDFSTGGLGRKAQKAKRKDGDRDFFMENAWRDPWKFTLKNKGLVIRTAIYLSIGYLLSLSLLWLMFWCYNLPPKAFSAFLASVAMLMMPGWLWFLTIEIIQGTLEKKDKLKRIHFDFFLCAATGLKAIAWQFVFFLPTSLIGGICLFAFGLGGNPLVGWIVYWLLQAMLLPLVPIVMVHMAMPVSGKAWLSPLMIPILFKNLAPTLYVCVIFFVTNLAVIGGMTAVGLIYGSDVGKFVETLDARAEFQRLAEEKEATKNSNKVVIPQLVPEVPAEIPVADYGSMVVPLLATYASLLMFSFTAVYNMRVVGLFGAGCKKDLDLVSQVKEKAYVRKEVELGPDGQPLEKKSSGNQVAMTFAGLGGTLAFYIIANVILFFSTGGKVLLLPRPLAQMLNRMAANEEPENPAPVAPGPPAIAPPGGATPPATTVVPPATAPGPAPVDMTAPPVLPPPSGPPVLPVAPPVPPAAP